MVSPHSTEATRGKLGFRPALDGIRAAAVLSVLAFHAHTRLIGGGIGVDIFFVLSGFLITTLLLEEWDQYGSIALRAFYGRRARRLLPALFLTIALIAVVYTAFSGIDHGIGFGWSALLSTFYVANFARADLGLFFHTWSLALEEQFYLVWPVVLIACLRRGLRTRSLLLVAFTGVVASSAIRATLWGINRDAFPLNWRADGLLLGCAVAIVWNVPTGRAALKRTCGHPAAGIGAALFLLIYALAFDFTDAAMFYGGLTLVAAAAAILIVHVLEAERSLLTRVLSIKSVVWLGRRSYGVYLFHPIAFVVVNRYFETLWPRALFGLALTILIAAASFRFVESPFLRRKRYHRRDTELATARAVPATN